MITLLLPLMIMSDPVPIAGRPADFSGAVGGPFVVTMKLDKTEFLPGHSTHLIVTVKGSGDLSKIELPDLNKDKEWGARFQIDEHPNDNPSTDPQARTFEFHVRPKKFGPQQLPRLRFVYFNPAIKPANKGWQTTYAEPIDIVVGVPKPPELEVSPQLRAWQLRLLTSDYDHKGLQSWIVLARKIGLSNPLIGEMQRKRMISEAKIDSGPNLSKKSLATAIATLARNSRDWPENELFHEGLTLIRKLVEYPADASTAELIQPEPRYWPNTLFDMRWIWVALVAWSILGLLVLRSVWRFLLSARKSTSPRYRVLKYGSLVALLMLAMLPLANLGVLHLRSQDDKARPPIVVKIDTELRTGNGTDYEIKQSLPLGVEARQVNRRGDWAQIEFVSGLTGWIPVQAIWYVDPRDNAP